jgi:mannose-6-phosphate isomerase-like protein (cupin superfamily)
MPRPSFHTSVLLRSEQTAGRVAAVSNVVPAGWPGPPLHHHAFDEAFYVLEGELTFQLGDALATAPAGTFAFAPGGVEHTLANLGSTEARYLLLCTPAGFERYFDRVASEAAGVAPPPEAAGPIPETTVVGGPLVERSDSGSAQRLAPVAGGVNVRVRGAESAERVSIMENVVSPDFPGPRLHHHAFDELFCVVEGELTFQLGDRRLTRGAGEIAFVPGGAHHTFANLSGAPARTLIACTPAGFERYFARMAAKQRGVDPPAWADGPIPEVTAVGPPLARE